MSLGRVVQRQLAVTMPREGGMFNFAQTTAMLPWYSFSRFGFWRLAFSNTAKTGQASFSAETYSRRAGAGVWRWR
jgi:hypothetical protein